MRTIKKRQVPAKLVAWRQERISKKDPVAYPFNYKAFRSSDVALAAVEKSLYDEQGGICAYTGRRITREGNKEGQTGFHIEHLKPQKHCDFGEDCDYSNLVACWPEPNQEQGTPYGAVLKDSWPSPAEAHLFISPLRADCTKRFKFSTRQEDPEKGKPSRSTVWMEPSEIDDIPAMQTITKLNLNDHELRALRWGAVRGTLNPPGITHLKLSELEKLAKAMDKAEQDLDSGSAITLDPFCFAVRPALEKLIHRRRASSKTA